MTTSPVAETVGAGGPTSFWARPYAPALGAFVVLAIATHPASSSLVFSVDSWSNLDLLPSREHLIGEGRFLVHYLSTFLAWIGDGDVVSPTATILVAAAIYAAVIARVGSEFIPAVMPRARVAAAMTAAAVPFAVEFFYFSHGSIAIVIGIGLATMGVVIDGRSAHTSVLRVVLVAAGLATYQNGLNFAAVVLAGCVIVATASEGWQGFREGLARALRGAIVVIAGIAVWYVSSRLVMLATDIEAGARFGLLSLSELPDRLRQLLFYLDDVYVREESYFRTGAKIVLFLGLSLTALASLTTSRIPRMLAALALFAVSLPATTYGVQLVTFSFAASFRNFAHVALFAPILIGAVLGTGVVARLGWSRARRATLAAAACFLALFVYGSTARMNALFVNQSRQDTVDHLVAADVVERARELEGWVQVDRVVVSPCCFSGVGPGYAIDLPKLGTMSTRAVSAFAQPWSVPHLMAEVSERRMLRAAPADYAAGDLVCQDSPRYPDEGSIHVAETSLVICRR